MIDTSKQIESLSERKRKLFEMLMREKASKAARGQSIKRREGIEQAPLSYSQQQMWILNQIDRDGGYYNQAASINIKGKVDLTALERAIEEIVRRHESLRTVYKAAGGQPLQLITPPGGVRLDTLDLTALPAEEREERARREARLEAAAGFDLERGPVMRAKAVRVSEEEVVVLVTMHHICTDGWSMGVFMREMGRLYESYRRGEGSPLEELPIQYADYAIWQREQIEGGELSEQLNYWVKQLEGASGVIELPTDRPRPARESFEAAEETFEIGEELSEGLKMMSRGQGVTLYMTLLAAFKALLYRYSGQEDIVVGTPIANRGKAELEGLIGYFVNTLVMRTDLGGDPTFKELLMRVRDTTLAAYAHQNLPIEKLMEELSIKRDLTRMTLHQVVFNLMNVVNHSMEFSDVVMSRTELPVRAKLDWMLEMVNAKEGLKGWLVYKTDLVDKTTAERMVKNYKALLEQVVHNPDQRLSSIPLLSESARLHIIDSSSQCSDLPLPRQTFIEMFHSQVERSPNSTAATYHLRQLSYQQLNGRANRLAHLLIEHGVGPDGIVGLIAPRDLDLLTAVLAVLKAGGAYLPLDPLYPADRLRQVLTQSGARLVLTATQFAHEVRQCLSGRGEAERPLVLEIEGLLAREQGPEAERNPPVRSGLSNLAYVIYTSGSTGVPKGVMIEQRGMINHIQVKIKDLAMSHSDRVGQTASQCFDISVWQMLASLLVGGEVDIFDEEESREAGRLVEKVVAGGLTIIEVVPSLLRAMLEVMEVRRVGAEELRRLRWLVVTGEALPAELCERWLSKYGQTPLVNAYGPTECSDDVTHEVIRELELEAGRGVPIGRAVGNTSVYVLDKWMQPVPVGVVGEIYVGGAGVGRGYLGDAAKTAEVFLADPYGERGGRLYKTGDRGRRLADGRLEYRGRVDQQVKVRGYRIELGEIEAAMRQQEWVKEAVVDVREEKGGEKRLVGYVVTRGEERDVAKEMREQLRKWLPEYMIPSAYVRIEEVPVSRSGKVERARLPEPEWGGGAEEGPKQKARSPIEGILGGIWGEVLGVSEVGVDENFFELGGHSLLAMQVIWRASDLFNVSVSLRDLFESPTVAGLATVIEETIKQNKRQTTAPIQPRPRDGLLPASFSQERMWFLDQMGLGDAAYNISAGLRLLGKLDTNALERAIEEIVRRHESLRTVYKAAGGQPLQLITPPGGVRLATLDLTALPAEEREERARREARLEAAAGFDLERGPVMRAKAVRVSEEEVVVLVTMHHICTDGWSMGVFMREMGRLYESYRRGEGSPLEELPIQYADYAIWQREWMRTEEFDKQMSYWRQQLEGAPTVLELPTDRARPAVQSNRGGSEAVWIDERLTEGLKRLSRAAGVTLYMSLLAAYKVLLMRYSNQEEIVVGADIANRNRRELEPLIGFFVNMLVLRTSLSGEPTFTELLSRVREVTLGAYANQDLPFEKLVEELQPERSLSHSPLFQVSFVLQNAPVGEFELPGLVIKMMETGGEAAKFDLELSLVETGGGVAGTILYSSDLFDRKTIRMMADHYVRIVEAAVAGPDVAITALQMLGQQERYQILVEWNQTARPYQRQPHIHELIEQQVERQPEAVALKDHDRQITYQLLNARANQLAHHLISLGVGPGVVVGICLHRSMEMITSMLAVLKAGAAYVPLDPKLPADRIKFIVEDSAAEAVICQQADRQAVEQSGVTQVVLERDEQQISRHSESNPGVKTSDKDLVYVMYTSGSTGRPKGVEETHEALSWLVWNLDHLEIRPDDVVAQASNASFDAIVYEVWGGLVHGAKVVLVNTEEMLVSGELIRRLEQERITVMYLTAALFAQVVRQEPRAFSSLRVLACGGESMDARCARAVIEAGGPAHLIHEYGPTEATVFATQYEVKAVKEEGSRVPIGRAMSNTKSYVLDRRLEPVPEGVAGEMY
ncbi:MAG TPA: amino acid adenylation domain-containing protein, partial [Blastocatellia bacterium]|nr:amino acid adenylation domain-containing protein [Blastocatellia bacterium]